MHIATSANKCTGPGTPCQWPRTDPRSMRALENRCRRFKRPTSKIQSGLALELSKMDEHEPTMQTYYDLVFKPNVMMSIC